MPNPIPSHNRSRRRGSALMVSLALLMMLAVFAALFLTSSRFDMDASAADLDYVRMDLYAEGLSQYIQSCLVAGLWGFDTVPLNNDYADPYKDWSPPPSNTFSNLIAIASNPNPGGGLPGPDAPFDYFGGEVLLADENGSLNTGTIDYADETSYFPNFWLADPRARQIQDYSTAVTDNHIVRNAFAPRGLGRHTSTTGSFSMPAYAPYWNTNYNNDRELQWDWADMDSDGRADTPWLFRKPLGNGLYIRAAVRVEDTSSRINLNTANHPLYVQRTANEEALTRRVLYPGYPFFLASQPLNQFIFPLLSIGGTDPNFTDPSDLGRNAPWVDSLGVFLSEMNLAALTGNSALVQQLNNGVSTVPPHPAPDMPGRFGMSTASVLPDAPSVAPPTVGALMPDPLAALLGNPNSQTILATGAANPAYGFSGRLGDWLCSWYNNTSNRTWSNDSQWPTFDPDGIARRLEAVTNYTGSWAPDQDRPFGPDETFDLVAGARWPKGLSGATRLERLWPALMGSTASPQFAYALPYRQMFTTYSWTLDICPYGEDPYAAVTGALPGTHFFRKVNLNTCTGREFEQALRAAGRHQISGNVAQPTVETIGAQLAANLLDYRDRPMTRAELATYLNWRRSYLLNFANQPVPQPAEDPNPAVSNDSTGWPQAIQLEWDQYAWERHVACSADPTGQTNYSLDLEKAYFAKSGPNGWQSDLANNLDQLIQRLSHDSSTIYPAITTVSIGLDRSPFITELYAQINSYVPDEQNPALDLVFERKRAWTVAGNYFAIELYNPYPDPISIEHCRLLIGTPDNDMVVDPEIIPRNNPPLNGYFWRLDFHAGVSNPQQAVVIPANGYLVICNNIAAAPNAGRVYVDPDFRFYPESRIMLLGRGVSVNGNSRLSPQDVVLDEVPRAANFTWPSDPPLGARRDISLARWDRDGGFWLQHNNGAWQYQQVDAPGDLTPYVGRFNGIGPLLSATPYVFASVPSIANQGSTSFLSPAEITNLLRVGPDVNPSSTTSDPQIRPVTTKLDEVWNPTPSGDDLKLALFNRSYQPVDPDGTIRSYDALKYTGLAQSLMDFITTIDFACDGVDNDGNGVTDVASGSTNVDPMELRVPGRLNVNTISKDAFDQLDTRQIPLLPGINPRPGTKSPLDGLFWHTLTDYRDLQGWYGTYNPNNPLSVPDRSLVTVGISTGVTSPPGIRRLGDLCNIQNNVNPVFRLFGGFWQTRASLAYPGVVSTTDLNKDSIPDFLLPAQHIRRFARSANLLTTRSDTYMVTIRVEIVRPAWTDTDGNGTMDALDQIESMGQREYMYLMDRSYCVRPPQINVNNPNPATAGSGIRDPLLNGQFNAAFVPPRVWRMTIPSYLNN